MFSYSKKLNHLQWLRLWEHVSVFSWLCGCAIPRWARNSGSVWLGSLILWVDQRPTKGLLPRWFTQTMRFWLFFDNNDANRHQAHFFSREASLRIEKESSWNVIITKKQKVFGRVHCIISPEIEQNNREETWKNNRHMIYASVYVSIVISKWPSFPNQTCETNMCIITAGRSRIRMDIIWTCRASSGIEKQVSWNANRKMLKRTTFLQKHNIAKL